MVYAGTTYRPSVRQLAQAGNLRAIGHWLNAYLAPHGARARVAMKRRRPGCLQVLVELHPALRRAAVEPENRDSLLRFICHRVYQLHSPHIEGVRVTVRTLGSKTNLWQQAVRLTAAPARRRPRVMTRPKRRVLSRSSRLKTASLVLSGSAAAAFVIGCWLGYSDAPSEQTSAVASPKAEAIGNSNRSDMVQAALEQVPVIKHQQVVNPQDPTVTLMFGGDVTLSDSYTDVAGNNPKWPFAKIDEYRQADLAMVNLEGPLTQATTPLADKQFKFKSEPEPTAKALKEGGIDIVTLANNHIMDYQEPGLTETLQALNQAGIQHVGAGHNVTEARRPDIIEVKGQRIAYLGYYGFDFQTAGDSTPGANYADEARISADIKAIRDQVDWVVVNYHWGQELADRPADWQVDLAHFTIDQGADLVVGHHPHVLQGAEIYKGRPIAYSLGNFIFGGKNRSDYDTAVLKVALKDKQMKVEFLPVEVRQFQPQVVSGEQGAKILQRIQQGSAFFQQPMQNSVILDARNSTPATTPAENPATNSLSPSPTSTPEGTGSTPASGSDQPATNAPSPMPSWSPKAPWGGKSFISNPPGSNANPATQEGAAPSQDGMREHSSITPMETPKPTRSLEPMKKHFADAGSLAHSSAQSALGTVQQ